jgi:hypothetical protein
MKKYLNYVIIGVVALLVGRFVLQPKPKTIEVVKYVEKKEETKKTKKITRTRERKNPDGSSQTETEVVEDSTSNSSTTIASEKTTSTSKGVSVGILALKNLDKFSEKLEYGAVVSVPVFGSLSVMGSADTTKRIGLGLALEF